MKLLLDQGELLDLGKNRLGLTIHCQCGTFWLTQAGDARDYILGDGEQFVVCRKGHLVIYATDPCRIQLSDEKSTALLLGPAAIPYAIKQRLG